MKGKLLVGEISSWDKIKAIISTDIFKKLFGPGLIISFFAFEALIVSGLYLNKLLLVQFFAVSMIALLLYHFRSIFHQKLMIMSLRQFLFVSYLTLGFFQQTVRYSLDSIVPRAKTTNIFVFRVLFSSPNISKFMLLLIGLCACLFIFSIFNFLLQHFLVIYQDIRAELDLTNWEKWFLRVYLIGTAVFIAGFYVLNDFAINTTDAIYSLDSGYVYHNIAGSFSYTDVRHLLMGYIFFPLKYISNTIGFLMGASHLAAEITFLWLQLLIVFASALVFRALVKNQFVLPLFLLSNMGVLSVLLVEKFQIVMLLMIIATFGIVHNKKELRYLALILAASATTTSAVLAFIKAKGQNWFELVKEWCYLIIYGAAAVIVLGKIDLIIFGYSSSAADLDGFGTNLGIKNRIYAYLDMISFTFVPHEFGLKRVVFFWSEGSPAYQVFTWAQVGNSRNWFGLLLFIVAVLGFILNYRGKLAQVLFGWLVFGIVLLVPLGWATQEAPLFTLYLGWAVVGLVSLFLQAILKSNRVVIGFVLTVTIIFICSQMWHISGIFKYLSMFSCTELPDHICY